MAEIRTHRCLDPNTFFIRAQVNTSETNLAGGSSGGRRGLCRMGGGERAVHAADENIASTNEIEGAGN